MKHLSISRNFHITSALSGIPETVCDSRCRQGRAGPCQDSLSDIPSPWARSGIATCCPTTGWNTGCSWSRSGMTSGWRLAMPWRPYAEFFQGEVNETKERANGNLLPAGGNGKKVTRGACICLYVPRDASQGQDIFLNAPRYLEAPNGASESSPSRWTRKPGGLNDEHTACKAMGLPSIRRTFWLGSMTASTPELSSLIGCRSSSSKASPGGASSGAGNPGLSTTPWPTSAISPARTSRDRTSAPVSR